MVQHKVLFNLSKGKIFNIIGLDQLYNKTIIVIPCNR